MRNIPYDIQTNISISRKVVGAILSGSKSFFPKNIDDLTAIGEENYTDGASNVRGNVVFHLDSKASNFHVDVCSETISTSLYNSKALVDNLLEYLSLHDFHRTKFTRRGFKNGRTIYTYCR